MRGQQFDTRRHLFEKIAAYDGHMNSMNADAQVSILARECEAIERYRELEAWFTDRNYDELAGLCARLATWHRGAYLRLAGTEKLLPVNALRAAVVPWVGPGKGSGRSSEFLWRLASPAQLLELALDAEPSEECAAKLRAALGKLGPVDWESAFEAGAVPSLALGADRRVMR
jgi:hypothetical protein